MTEPGQGRGVRRSATSPNSSIAICRRTKLGNMNVPQQEQEESMTQLLKGCTREVWPSGVSAAGRARTGVSCPRSREQLSRNTTSLPIPGRFGERNGQQTENRAARR